MAIPSYKKIHLKSETITEVKNQLSVLNFSQSPHIIIIEHLENQKLAIENLEFFLKGTRINFDVYPLYILTNLSDTPSKLNLIKELNQAPKFYYQKVKLLNVKENKLLTKIELKQRNLNALRYSDYKMHLKSYAEDHKKLAVLCNEGHFLDDLWNQLESKNE